MHWLPCTRHDRARARGFFVRLFSSLLALVGGQGIMHNRNSILAYILQEAELFVWRKDS